MLSIVRTYGPVKIYQKWFYPQPDINDIFSIVVYKQCSSLQSIPGFIRKKFFTLHIEIAIKSTDELFRDFSKTNQLKIKKAIKEDVHIEANNNIEEFVTFFNNFAQFKKLHYLTIKDLKIYNDSILFTWINKHNDPIAAHAYLIDKDSGIVRLLYSATKVRTEEDLDFISRSNRRLHWYDLCYFKEEGYKIYDMGGLALNSNNKETEGIDFFKKSFGGNIIEQSHYESVLAFIIKKILKKE